MVKPLVAGQTRLPLALDDTPTQRYVGPYVQGAGIHHNPTPGPAGAPHLYGHIWVVLGLLAVHLAWGVIALPLLCRLYVRKKDLPRIDPKHRPEFQTKLAMGVELLRLARAWLRPLGKPLWVVVDGAYAKAPFLKPAMSLGMTVVSRLRKNACCGRCQDLGHQDGAAGRGSTGKPHRAGPAGQPAARLVDRHLRAVRQAGEETVQDVRGDVAAGRRTHPGGAGGRAERMGGLLLHRRKGDRGRPPRDGRRPVRVETTFRDCKEIVDAGQQQVRFVWENVGAFHICLWTFTMTEAWAWSRSEDELVDRRASPWDDPDRRPSHADKRRSWRRSCWPRRFVRFYARGSPRRKFAPPRAIARFGRMIVVKVAESTDYKQSQ